MKSFCPREVPLNSLFVQYDDVNCFAQGKDSCIVVDPLFKYVIKRVALFFIHFSDLYHKAFRCLDDVNCFAQVKDSCIVVDPQFKYAIESFAQGRRALHCLKSTFPIFHKKNSEGRGEIALADSSREEKSNCWRPGKFLSLLLLLLLL